MNRKILFLYTSGRKERIEKAARGEAPREFFYGYTYFKKNGYDVNYLEIDYLLPPRLRFEHWRLKRYNEQFAKEVGIGSRSHFFVNQINTINNYNYLIATTDSIALGLAHHKKKGKLKGEIIYLNMGLAGALEKLKRKNNGRYEKYKKICGELMGQCKWIVSLGRGEHQFFSQEFPHLMRKFEFIPFGIDTDFWRPSDDSSKHDDPFVLFVGNDLNRDYDLLVKIVENCPDKQFKFVTSRLTQEQCTENVTLIKGSAKKYSLSDNELRRLYHQSSMVIIPLKETLQPSGQSVALQAMACGKLVVITRTSGLWDPHVLNHKKNLILVKKGSLEGFISYIKKTINGQLEMQAISIAARETVENYYRSDLFSNNLIKLINNDNNDFS